MSDREKAGVEKRANELIETWLKPNFIEPPPADNRFNYLVDISSKWNRNFFYFCSRHCSPGPNAISPYFDNRFARMECIGKDCFNLAYMRHTGQWNVIFFGLTLDECLQTIKEMPHFRP
jgi:hypothetical protein